MLHPEDCGGPSTTYSETFNRSRNMPSDPSFLNHTTKAILTDRGQYLNYLEAQLDRVTTAMMAHTTLDTRMNEVDGKLTQCDERISNMSKIARLSQSFSERWGEDTAATVNRLTERLARLEGVLNGSNTSSDETKSLITGVTDHMSTLAKMREDEMSQIESTLKSQKELNETSETKFSTLNKKLKTMEERFELKVKQVETVSDKKITALKQNYDKRVEELERVNAENLSRQDAEIARLRHEASLTENRMLSALAKQANVSQEQIASIQSTRLEAGNISSNSNSNSNSNNKVEDRNSWWNDNNDNNNNDNNTNNNDSSSNSHSRNFNNNTLNNNVADMMDDLEEVLNNQREHRKLLKDHAAILHKHDRAGGIVEENIEVLTKEVSLTQSPLALMKTRILAMNPAKLLQT